ncbi:MAG: hypothetical protein U0325_00210 [Polyangiales bacterium]
MSSQPRGPVLVARGRSTPGADAPVARSSRRAVGDHLLAPESHAQVVDGVRVRTLGASPPHTTRHFAVAHVFVGALAFDVPDPDRLSHATGGAEKRVTRGVRRAFCEARGVGRAQRPMRVARWLVLDEAARARIDGCDDVAALNGWRQRAVTATRLDEVIGERHDAAA